MIKRIDVIYVGWGQRWTLGYLADNGEQILFEFSEEALKKQFDYSPIKMKLNSGSFGNFPNYLMRLPGFIYDHLPDGWGLLLMDKAFRRAGIRAISPLDRLAFIGDKALGALSFEPSTHQELERQDFTLLDLAKQVVKILDEDPKAALNELVALGGSAQGARPKVLVDYNKKLQTISTDPNKIENPWLFKFPSQFEHKEVCAIESLYAQLAKKAGIEIKETDFFELSPKLTTFGTKRFDRKNHLRLPIHTLAGALHADFRSPSSVDYLTFLLATKYFTKSAIEVEKAFRQAVFNVLFNNRDDHPKNFSFLMNENQQWKLSPAYDLTFSQGPGGEHCMDICGEGRAPTLAHLLSLGEKAGLSKKRIRAIVDEVATQATQFKKMGSHWPIRKRTLDNIWTHIESNLRLFKR